MRHSRSNTPRIVVICTSTTKVFFLPSSLALIFTLTISRIVPRGLLDELSKKVNLAFDGVVFSKHPFESAHFVDVGGERRLYVVKLSLEVSESCCDGARCYCRWLWRIRDDS
jgi:hypothetical protein